MLERHDKLKQRRTSLDTIFYYPLLFIWNIELSYPDISIFQHITIQRIIRILFLSNLSSEILQNYKKHPVLASQIRNECHFIKNKSLLSKGWNELLVYDVYSLYDLIRLFILPPTKTQSFSLSFQFKQFKTKIKDWPGNTCTCLICH